eukprot:542431-Pelagomonas_calceolata.AAC.5
MRVRASWHSQTSEQVAWPGNSMLGRGEEKLSSQKEAKRPVQPLVLERCSAYVTKILSVFGIVDPAHDRWVFDHCQYPASDCGIADPAHGRWAAAMIMVSNVLRELALETGNRDRWSRREAFVLHKGFYAAQRLLCCAKVSTVMAHKGTKEKAQGNQSGRRASRPGLRESGADGDASASGSGQGAAILDAFAAFRDEVGVLLAKGKGESACTLPFCTLLLCALPLSRCPGHTNPVYVRCVQG